MEATSACGHWELGQLHKTTRSKCVTGCPQEAAAARGLHSTSFKREPRGSREEGPSEKILAYPQGWEAVSQPRTLTQNTLEQRKK